MPWEEEWATSSSENLGSDAGNTVATGRGKLHQSLGSTPMHMHVTAGTRRLERSRQPDARAAVPHLKDRTRMAHRYGSGINSPK